MGIWKTIKEAFKLVKSGISALNNGLEQLNSSLEKFNDEQEARQPFKTLKHEARMEIIKLEHMSLFIPENAYNTLKGIEINMKVLSNLVIFADGILACDSTKVQIVTNSLPSEAFDIIKDNSIVNEFNSFFPYKDLKKSGYQGDNDFINKFSYICSSQYHITKLERIEGSKLIEVKSQSEGLNLDMQKLNKALNLNLKLISM